MKKHTKDQKNELPKTQKTIFLPTVFFTTVKKLNFRINSQSDVNFVSFYLQNTFTHLFPVKICSNLVASIAKGASTAM